MKSWFLACACVLACVSAAVAQEEAFDDGNDTAQAVVLARAYVQEERFDEALRTLVEAVERGRDAAAIADCYFDLAVSSARRNDIEEALRCFERCLAARPDFEAARLLQEAVLEAKRRGSPLDIQRQPEL